ncbi:MAG: hypothetical protein GY754_34465 [bacterium]|nr:hypothetical protein [bacterium]
MKKRKTVLIISVIFLLCFINKDNYGKSSREKMLMGKWMGRVYPDCYRDSARSHL